MGHHAHAHLAYGYDLGDVEKFHVTETDEDGDPRPPWLGEDDDFGEQAEARMSDVPGVELDFYGTDSYWGWALIVVASHRDAVHADVSVLDLDHLAAQPEVNGWDDQLARAIETLQITPTQDHPRWLVYPSYDG